MIVLKTFRNILFFPRKSNISNRNISNFFKPLPSIKRSRDYSRYTNAVFASTALVGIAAYITYKRNVLCEKVEVLDIKELNCGYIQKYDEAICKSRDVLQRLKVKI